MKKKQIQVSAPRCSWGRRIGMVIGLFSLLTAVQVQAQFSGDFNTLKWTFHPDPLNPGTYAWVNPVGNTADGLVISGGTLSGSSENIMDMTYGGGGTTLEVNWTLDPKDNFGLPLAFLRVGIAQYALALGSGSISVPVLPGPEYVAFDLQSELPGVPGTVVVGKVPATLTVSIRESTVPDSSLGGLALLPMLGFLAFHAYKQNRREVTVSTVGRR